MPQKLISASLVGGTMLLGTVLAAQPAFNFVPIDYPDAIVTEAQGINSEGDIVGLYTDKAGAVHGYILRRGVFTTVDYPGAAFTYLTGVNPNGDVVGVFSMPNEIPGVVFGPSPVSTPVNVHGFVLKRDGTFTPLAYPGHPHLIAQRILPDGSVLGCYHDADFGFWMRGFLWNRGIYTSLDGTFDGLDVPSSMNNGATPGLEQIVGFFMDMGAGKLRSYVIRNGSLAPFDYPGASSTRAWDVNSLGAIVGDYRDATGAHGFLVENGSFEPLSFPRADVTQARGINARGAIVGWHQDTTGTHGFVAIPIPGPGR